MGRKPTKPGSIPHLRVRVKGSRTFYYYDCGGRPRKEIPLGSDYGLAIKRWAELEGTRDAPEVRQAITLRYVANEYRKQVVPTKAPRTQRDNTKEIAKLLEFFDDPPGPLDAIEPQHVRQYLTWRGKTAKSRANREKATLSAMWNFARDRGYTALPNPCAGIKGHAEKPRDVYVDDATYRAIWNAACEPLRDAMDLGYLTGQRPADVLKMDERDLRDGVIEVTQRKTGAKLRIEIVGELKDALARIKARKRGYAVHCTRLVLNESGQPLSHQALQDRFDKARKRAGVTGVQFRDLRAKAATDKAESAGDVRQAQRQLGHSTVTMTEAYIRARRGAKVTPTK